MTGRSELDGVAAPVLAEAVVPEATRASRLATPLRQEGLPAGSGFDIQRFSIHDGPGIRTTVFLKGCPLTCAWCANAEGRDSSQEISLIPGRCIRCGACIDVCPQAAANAAESTAAIDRAPGGGLTERRTFSATRFVADPRPGMRSDSRPSL